MKTKKESANELLKKFTVARLDKPAGVSGGPKHETTSGTTCNIARW